MTSFECVGNLLIVILAIEFSKHEGGVPSPETIVVRHRNMNLLVLSHIRNVIEIACVVRNSQVECRWDELMDHRKDRDCCFQTAARSEQMARNRFG